MTAGNCSILVFTSDMAFQSGTVFWNGLLRASANSRRKVRSRSLNAGNAASSAAAVGVGCAEHFRRRGRRGVGYNVLHQRAEEFGHLPDLFCKIDLINGITDCITCNSTARVLHSFIGSDEGQPII